MTFCHGLKLTASNGKQRETDSANTEALLRSIQSIPSPKAEPFKRWLAQVGYERLQEIENPELAARFDPVLGGRRLKNYLKVMTLEAQTIARACGKNHLHNLEPEDLCALTIEGAAMAGVPLAGTNWIPGRNGGF